MTKTLSNFNPDYKLPNDPITRLPNYQLTKLPTLVAGESAFGGEHTTFVAGEGFEPTTYGL